MTFSQKKKTTIQSTDVSFKFLKNPMKIKRKAEEELYKPCVSQALIFYSTDDLT